MRQLLIGLIILLSSLSPAYALNTHTLPTGITELQAWVGDFGHAYIKPNDCTPTIPGSGVTFSGFTCHGYVQNALGWLSYVSQASNGVGPLSSGDGTYWVAIHRDIDVVVAGWTRQVRSHYMWQKSVSQPATPSNGLIFLRVVVSGGNIIGRTLVASTSSTQVPGLATDARACGVLADGITDDTPALNNCLALHSHVIISEGRVHTAGTIQFNIGNRLSGVTHDPTDYELAATGGLATVRGSRIEYTGSGDAIAFLAPAFSTAGTYIECACSIDHLTIHSTTGAVGLHFKNTLEVYIDHVYVFGKGTGFTTAGLWFDHTLTSQDLLIVARVTNSRFNYNAGYGILAQGGNNLNAISLHNSYIVGNTLGGLHVAGNSRGWSILGNDIEGNGGNQLYVERGEAWHVAGNYFEVTPFALSSNANPLLRIRWCTGCGFYNNNMIGAGSAFTPYNMHLGDSSMGMIARGITIQGNNCLNAATCWGLEMVRGATIQNNVIINDVTKELGGSWANVLGISYNGADTTLIETTPTVAGWDAVSTGIGNSTTETVLYSYSVPGHMMQLYGGGIKLNFQGSVLNAGAGPVDVTIRVKYGGVTLSVLRWQAVAVDGGARALVIRGNIAGYQSNPGNQTCYFEGLLGAPSTVQNTVIDTGATDRFHTCQASVPGADMTVAQTLQVTAQLSVAHANSQVNKDSAYVIRVPY